MLKTVIAIATSESHAQSILSHLRKSGVFDKDISLLRATPAAHTSEANARANGDHAAAPLDGIDLLPVPNADGFMAAGPVFTGLSGKASKGVTAGLVTMGVPETDAKAYEGKLVAGDILIALHGLDADRVGATLKAMRDVPKTETKVIPEHTADAKRPIVPEVVAKPATHAQP